MLFDLLYGYQKDAVKAALPHRGFGLFMPLGSGKTVTALAIIERRWARGQISRVLVVCSKSLALQWREAIGQWLPNAVIVALADAPDGAALAVHITTYEAAREALKSLRRRPFDMMVCDESHKLKNRGSKQSRRLALVSRTVMYRLALTGTPVEGNELDFWPQMRYIDPRVFGITWADFKDEWTRPAGFRGKKPVLRRDKRTPFLDAIKRVSFTITKEEALDLPPVVDKVVPVQLTGGQLKVYREMEEEMLAELPTGEMVAAPLVVTQLMRLQQITGGWLTHDDIPHPVGTAKQDALAAIVADHPAPMVIYCRFLQEIRDLATRLRIMGRRVSVIAGNSRDSHKDFDVLICQIGVIEGLDGMQERASTACFYSKSFSSIQYEQAKGRIHRHGQVKKTTFLHINVLSSIDQDLHNAIQSKRDTIASVITYLRKRAIMAKAAKNSVNNAKPPKKAPAVKVVKAAKEPAAPKEPKAEKPGYGITYLADQLGVEPASVRIKLRKNGVEKVNGRYSWDRKTDADAVVKQLASKRAQKQPEEAAA